MLIHGYDWNSDLFKYLCCFTGDILSHHLKHSAYGNVRRSCILRLERAAMASMRIDFAILALLGSHHLLDPSGGRGMHGRPIHTQAQDIKARCCGLGLCHIVLSGVQHIHLSGK